MSTANGCCKCGERKPIRATLTIDDVPRPHCAECWQHLIDNWQALLDDGDPDAIGALRQTEKRIRDSAARK